MKHDQNGTDKANVLKSVNVLYVEDDIETRELASKYLKRSIPNLTVACCAEEALQLTTSMDIDIVVTDVMMGGMDGMDFALKMKERNPSCFVVLSTAYSDKDRLLRAVDIKIDKYIVKPIDWRKLIDIIVGFAERSVAFHAFDSEMPTDEGIVTGELFTAINSAVDDISQGLALLAAESPNINSIKAVRSFEEAKRMLEIILRAHF